MHKQPRVANPAAAMLFVHLGKVAIQLALWYLAVLPAVAWAKSRSSLNSCLHAAMASPIEAP